MTAPIEQRITNLNTCWIFVSGSPEDRHLYDVVIGVDCLRKRGVKDEDIYLFVDHPAKMMQLPLFGITKNIFTAKQVTTELAKLKSYEHAFVIIGGHGSPEGIEILVPVPVQVLVPTAIQQRMVRPAQTQAAAPAPGTTQTQTPQAPRPEQAPPPVAAPPAQAGQPVAPGPQRPLAAPFGAQSLTIMTVMQLQKAHITPHQLYSAVRSIPGLQSGVVVPCQCYAGTFNYIDAFTPPELIVLGSCNLNLSFSGSIELDQPIKKTNNEELKSWAANVFQLQLSLWLKDPVDTDGDGKKTILDAFKFAGARANERLRLMKRGLHFEVEALRAAQLKNLSGFVDMPHTPHKPQMFLKVQAAQSEMNRAVEMLYLSQEPWILNANPARQYLVW